MKKKVISVLAAAAVATSMFATPVLADGDVKAGVVWYNFADTFIANARQCLNGIAAADGTISITDADSENDINTQGNNVNNFYQHASIRRYCKTDERRRCSWYFCKYNKPI